MATDDVLMTTDDVLMTTDDEPEPVPPGELMAVTLPFARHQPTTRTPLALPTLALTRFGLYFNCAWTA